MSCCASRLPRAAAQPAVAQERKEITKSLISQGVPVRWGEHRHVVAGKGADALMPVSDFSSVKVTQQPETPSPSASRAAAQKVFSEGEKLRQQGTAESLKAAIEKYFQALPLFPAAGDKRREALTLHNIGAVYNSLGEKQKALDYISLALPQPLSPLATRAGKPSPFLISLSLNATEAISHKR